MEMRRQYWIIFYAIIIHLAWGIVLVVDNVPLHTTAIDSVFRIFSSPGTAGIAYIVASLAAIVAMFRPATLKNLLLIIPQQYFLMLSAFSAMGCISRSAFADGIVRSRAFIFVDQLPIIVAAVLHTCALCEIYAYDSIARFTGKIKTWMQ